MKKSILLAAFGGFITVLFLVLSIISYEFYQDQYGTDISFNSDYVTLMIMGIVILITGITLIKKDDKKVKFNGLGLVGIMSIAYPLGCLFKGLAKGGFNYQYIIWAIIGTFILLYAYFDYQETK